MSFIIRNGLFGDFNGKNKTFDYRMGCENNEYFGTSIFSIKAEDELEILDIVSGNNS